MTEEEERTSNYKLWKSHCDPEPMTSEVFLYRAKNYLTKVRQEPKEYPKRIVSFKTYKAAEEAIAAGATDREVELVLMGATLDQVKAWGKE